MLRSKARWNVNAADEASVREMAEALDLSPLIAKLLEVRGIRTKEQAELFLNGGAEHFHDPILLDGMQRAVERIRLAIRRDEKIRIYGDYDADGVSSTSLMIFLMRELKASFDFYIPHRVHEGYGLNREALDRARENGVSLIVTVDTGISAREEVAYACELGIDVIVTDHHEPPELLPDALAVINPKKPGCPYPFKQLAGVGVAFKLAHALLGRLPEELLELAAIGTVADLMPLVDENRLIVKLGLERLRKTGNAGLTALLQAAGIDRRELTAGHVGFALAPRINASGRLDSADHAVRLLTTCDEREAAALAGELDALNKERQKIVEEMTKEALELVERKKASGSMPQVLVLAKEGWNVGVIGIVASRILEKYYRPTVVLGIDPETGIAKGSARSIAGFDIYRALSSCSELFEHFGGHQAAAGMSLEQGNIAELEAKLAALAASWLTPDDFLPILQADAACGLDEVPLEAIRELERLAPFGIGNPSPRFVFCGLQIREKKTMGRDQQHLKLILTNPSPEPAAAVEAIGFGLGAAAENIASTAKIDLLGELAVNEWNGTRKPQIVIQDLRVPEPQVFDWRGGTWNGRAFAEGGPLGVLLFAESERQRLPRGLAELNPAVWCVAEDQRLLRLDSGGDSGSPSFADLRQLLLYTLPPRLSVLETVLREAAAVERLYAVFADLDDPGLNVLPEREAFKSIYAFVRQQGVWKAEDERLLAALSRRSGLSKAGVAFVLRVFEELHFIEEAAEGYRFVASPVKRDLTESARYRRMMHRRQVEQALIYSSSQELSRYLLSSLPSVKAQHVTEVTL